MENGKLSAAINFAIEKHGNQTDKGGVIYTEHLFEVMCDVKPENRVIAVLHDVIEDTDATIGDIQAAVPGLTRNECNALIRLTKKYYNSNETYEEYIERLLDVGDDKISWEVTEMAKDVKIADLKHNLSNERHVDSDAGRSLFKRNMKVLERLSPIDAFSIRYEKEKKLYEDFVK